MDIYKALGNRIREKRLQLELSQEKLSEMCNLSPSFIGVIERCEKRPSVETIVKIANALKVNVNYLLSDSVTYDNTDYIGKAHDLLSDMDDREIKYAYDFLSNFRDFQGKKPVD
ncbi:MAG: helix-turn-helix transcriptional regulator [Clostridia bacterium]|nr:helix-turn-helix transcriptional regulator [Clostridia bacterium]